MEKSLIQKYKEGVATSLGFITILGLLIGVYAFVEPSVGPIGNDYVLDSTSKVGKVQFAGYTANTYTGNLGGMTGANAKCQAEFSGSHFCSTLEFVRSGHTINPISNSWIFSESTSTAVNFGGGTLYSTYNNHGCSGWDNDLSTFLGSAILSTGSYGGGISCDNSLKLTCCY